MSIKKRNSITRKLTIVRHNNDYDGLPTPKIVWDESTDSFCDAVMLNLNDYKEIFGTSRAKSSRKLKHLSVVKITSKDGYSIHRRYYSTGKAKAGEVVGLTLSSIRLLSKESISEYLSTAPEVSLSKGSKLLYYWENPILATAISVRLGLISIILGVLSIALALI